MTSPEREVTAELGLAYPSVRDHVNAPTFSVEHDLAVHEREKSKVVALPDVLARVKTIADLPDQDIPGSNLLSAKPLHAATLRIGIASVSAGTLTLFMRHY